MTPDTAWSIRLAVDLEGDHSLHFLPTDPPVSSLPRGWRPAWLRDPTVGRGSPCDALLAIKLLSLSCCHTAQSDAAGQPARKARISSGWVGQSRPHCPWRALQARAEAHFGDSWYPNENDQRSINNAPIAAVIWWRACTSASP